MDFSNIDCHLLDNSLCKYVQCCPNKNASLYLFGTTDYSVLVIFSSMGAFFQGSMV
jgi:hypothetical protein